MLSLSLQSSTAVADSSEERLVENSTRDVTFAYAPYDELQFEMPTRREGDVNAGSGSASTRYTKAFRF